MLQMYFQTYFSKILNVFLLHRSIILCTTIFRTFLILQIPLRQLAIWKLYSARLIFDQIMSHTQISGKVSTEKKKQLIVKTVLWQLVLSFQPLDQVILTRITSHNTRRSLDFEYLYKALLFHLEKLSSILIIAKKIKPIRN